MTSFTVVLKYHKQRGLVCCSPWGPIYSQVIQSYIYTDLLFHYVLSQDIGYSSLCYTVGPYYLSTICMIAKEDFINLIIKIVLQKDHFVASEENE